MAAAAETVWRAAFSKADEALGTVRITASEVIGGEILPSNLVPVLQDELLCSMDVWVAIHPDVRSDRRIRLTFDYQAKELTHYAKTSRDEE